MQNNVAIPYSYSNGNSSSFPYQNSNGNNAALPYQNPNGNNVALPYQNPNGNNVALPYQNPNGNNAAPYQNLNGNNASLPYQNLNGNNGYPFNRPNSIPQQIIPPNNFPIQNNLNNPGIFRGITSNAQPQTNPNKLSEQQYYEDNKTGLMQNARRGFIVKVYVLLTLQLILTTIIGYIGYNNPLFNQFILQTPVIIIVTVGILAVSLIIGCCTNFFRRYALPLFIIFTVLMALLVAISICGFKSKVVLLSAAITLLLVLALTVFACTTSYDITGCGVYLMMMGLIMIVFGIVAIFWQDPIVQLIYSCLAALLFGIYLVYDTQLVLGKNQYSYSLDDAYLAALQLYLDIIELFLNILQIVGYASN